MPYLAFISALPGCAIILQHAGILERLAEAQRSTLIQRRQLKRLAPSRKQA